MVREKALRRTDAVTLQSDTFVISQALAESTLRHSGVNFFTREGELGDTGKRLETLLNKFNRTVYPYQKVGLPSGKTLPACKDGLLPVYNTELAQSYPGKRIKADGKEEDRPPKVREINRCLGQGFIKEEFKLIQPKLLLLMGAKSRENFYKKVLNPPRPRKDKLEDHIESIVESGELPTERVWGLRVRVLPIYHASGRTHNLFTEMHEDQRLIDMIRQALATPT